jgi:hypothetical protein
VPIRDVQVQMGHASTETTARYDRANRRRDNPTVAALDRIIAAGAPLGDTRSPRAHVPGPLCRCGRSYAGPFRVT